VIGAEIGKQKIKKSIFFETFLTLEFIFQGLRSLRSSQEMIDVNMAL